MLLSISLVILILTLVLFFPVILSKVLFSQSLAFFFLLMVHYLEFHQFVLKLPQRNFFLVIFWSNLHYFLLQLHFVLPYTKTYLIDWIDFLDEDWVGSVHFLFEEPVKFGWTDELFGHDNLSVLLFGLVVLLFEDVGLLHVFFAHCFLSIEDKLLFRFLILEYWDSKKRSTFGVDGSFSDVKVGFRTGVFGFFHLASNLLYTLIGF